MKEKYLIEFEKYKHIEVYPGNYINKNKIEFRIISINEDKAEVQTIKSGMIKTRTLHWCRKNLTRNN